MFLHPRKSYVRFSLVTGCLYFLVTSLVLISCCTSAASSFTVAKPSASQAKLMDYEIGASIHFNMQTFNRSMSPGHVVSPDAFNPVNLSTDQWLQAAASFGARYAVLTLDHFSGFLLWPSKTNYSYSVKNSKWRNGTGDVASDFMKSCVKHGIEYGFYYSVHENWFMGVDDFTTGDPATQAIYQRVVEEQMIELYNPESIYRNPFYIWFDAGIVKGVSPNVGPIIRTLAADTICSSCPTFSGNQGLEWVGNEQADAPLPLWNAVPEGQCSINIKDNKVSKRDPLGKQFCPSSCDTVIREHHWFWKPNTTDRVKNVSTLVREYLTSVGRGCNLILNLNPDPSGLVPTEDVQAYEGLGKAVNLLYRDLVMKDDNPQLEVKVTMIWELKDFVSMENGSVVLMEDLERFGQLVEEYELQFQIFEGWIENPEKGSTIGHKRIHPLPSELAGKIIYSIGLTITKLVTNDNSIVLRQISVYDWSEAAQRGLI